MTNEMNSMSAREILFNFFSNLETIEGIDKETSRIIRKLWVEDKLGADEVLSALDIARNQEGNNVNKEA